MYLQIRYAFNAGANFNNLFTWFLVIEK